MQTTLWQALLGLFIAGYLALEGADFGAAMLLPVFGRQHQSGRDATVRAIAPLFLGNEVWLVAATGVTEGAFPALAGTLLASCYPLFVLILVAWLTRDAGLWFRSRGSATWRWRWDCATALASAALAAGWGVVVANLALGNLQSATPLVPSRIFGPAPVLSGLLLAGFCALHGSLFLNRRVPTQLATTVRKITRAVSLPVAALTAVVGVSVAVSDPPGRHWPLWLLAAILFTAALSARLSIRIPTTGQPGVDADRGRFGSRAWRSRRKAVASQVQSRAAIGRAALTLTSLALAAAVPLAALSGLLDVATGSSATLGVLTPVILAVAPFMIACQAGLWWLSRGTNTRSWSYF